jgi:hypothetical protein
MTAREFSTSLHTLAKATKPSLFEFFHEGTGEFYADIKTSDGKLVKVLAQTKGNYEGKTELEIPATDAYVVTIKTSGNWGLDFK